MGKIERSAPECPDCTRIYYNPSRVLDFNDSDTSCESCRSCRSSVDRCSRRSRRPLIRKKRKPPAITLLSVTRLGNDFVACKNVSYE
ncbi:hypothetical protein Avbf_03351 [Armadillidium vulgare]|nr:hypothetical protein Avbf_03351 [Armadillidium vulgare]